MPFVDRHFVVNGAVQSGGVICDCMLRQAHVLLSALRFSNPHASKLMIAMRNRRCVLHPHWRSAAEAGDALDWLTDSIEALS